MLERYFQARDARRSARAAHRSPSGSASFREKHPQGRDGRFVEKPDAPPAGRETVGALALKSSGVISADTIQVLVPRVRRYHGHNTVGDFVGGHPKGAAYARRVLAADHKAGRIGFSRAGTAPAVATGEPGAPRAGLDARITVLSRSTRKYRGHDTVGSFMAAHPRGMDHALRVMAVDVKAGRIRIEVATKAPVAARGSRWPGRAELRDTSRDEFTIVPGAMETGLFRDEAHLRATSAALLAGVPADQPMRVVWLKRPNGAVAMVATGLKADISVSRAFTRTSKGWEVAHNTFTLPRKYQGQGGARRMLRASVEAYDDLGISRITVHANIDVGGYAWAKTGFAVAEESADLTRETLTRAAMAHPRSHLAGALRTVLATSSDEDLMWNVARMKGPTGKPLGKAALLRSDWFGAMDLTSEKHRQRLATTFGGTGNG